MIRYILIGAIALGFFIHIINFESKQFPMPIADVSGAVA